MCDQKAVSVVMSSVDFYFAVSFYFPIEFLAQFGIALTIHCNLSTWQKHRWYIVNQYV